MASKIVLANGCFDPLHYGHLLHLEAARKLGDWLVVSVTADECVNKGPGRPVFSQAQRSIMLKALRCVDEVIIVGNANEALRKTRPNIFVKGSEYIGKISPEDEEFCNKEGIEIYFTHTEKYSSTDLLNHESRRR